MTSLCNLVLQFRQDFKGLRVSNHKVRVSNYLVQGPNPLLVIPKKFSAARGKKVRGLAQLIKYAFVASWFGSHFLPYRNLNYTIETFAIVLSSLDIYGVKFSRITLVISSYVSNWL